MANADEFNHDNHKRITTLNSNTGTGVDQLEVIRSDGQRLIGWRTSNGGRSRLPHGATSPRLSSLPSRWAAPGGQLACAQVECEPHPTRQSAIQLPVAHPGNG